MPITKQKKLERYDSTCNERDKLALAVHDLVNGKFSAEVRVHLKNYDPEWTGGFYGMRVSFRAMPLFLVRYVVNAQDDQCDVYTEQEIQELYRAKPTLVLARMLMDGRYALMEKYRPKTEIVEEVTLHDPA